MTVAADARTVTDAFIALLDQAGLTVGDGVAPTGAAPPYCIVYPVSATTVAGTAAAPSADVARVLQVTSVGDTREQAQWAADRAAAVLLGADHRTVAIAGRALMQPIGLHSSSGVQRDDTTAGPALFYAADLHHHHHTGLTVQMVVGRRPLSRRSAPPRARPTRRR